MLWQNWSRYESLLFSMTSRVLRLEMRHSLSGLMPQHRFEAMFLCNHSTLAMRKTIPSAAYSVSLSLEACSKHHSSRVTMRTSNMLHVTCSIAGCTNDDKRGPGTRFGPKNQRTTGTGLRSCLYNSFTPQQLQHERLPHGTANQYT